MCSTFQLLTSQQEATMTESKGTTTTSSTDPDAISWLRSILHSVDQRCTNLQSDLKKAQQVVILFILTTSKPSCNYYRFVNP